MESRRRYPDQIISRRSGWRRIFFRQTFASSKSIRVGAIRNEAARCRASVPLPGSPNSTAAIADASTTLATIPVLTDHVRRFAWRLQPKLADPLSHLLNAQILARPHGVLDDRQQLALQGAMMLCRPLPEA